MGFAELSLALERRTYTWLRALADRRSSLPPHLLLGERGEDAAFFHLRSLGYTVVARRWRSDRLAGDLDLVAWDGATLVIFEVKSRSSRGIAPAEMAVDEHKQEMLRKMASAYLRLIPELHRESVKVRFDVLSVYFDCGDPVFEHRRNAFSRD
ncbi:YraN family protein [Granulicella paludicola]|uniref:YraN family protein n=1 Tax=Granulicella paludicola TaxID=474951 RepID=UPI0021DF74E2|nr:YraN family protein [Granulicella paludicola]